MHARDMLLVAGEGGMMMDFEPLIREIRFAFVLGAILLGVMAVVWLVPCLTYLNDIRDELRKMNQGEK